MHPIGSPDFGSHWAWAKLLNKGKTTKKLNIINKNIFLDKEIDKHLNIISFQTILFILIYCGHKTAQYPPLQQEPARSSVVVQLSPIAFVAHSF